MVLLLVILLAVAGADLIPNPLHIIDLQSFEPDPKCDRKLFNFGSLKIADVPNKGKRFFGRVRLLQTIDGRNYTLESHLFKVLPTRNLILSKHYSTICDNLPESHYPWSVSVLPLREKCPLVKGLYQVYNFTIRSSFLRFMPKEQYFVTADLARDGLKVCGAKMTFRVVDSS